MPHPAVFTRLYTALADTALDLALDLAERARDRGEDRVMRKLLSIAQTHAIEGMKRSDAEFDQSGGMLARLAIVRQSQFVEASNTRRDIIAAVWRFAENSDEPDVMARVRIALAREYMKQGDVLAAHNLLRQVTGRSAASEVPYTGEPAKALLRRIVGYADWCGRTRNPAPASLSNPLRCCCILALWLLFVWPTQRSVLLRPLLVSLYPHIPSPAYRITTYPLLWYP
jgi:hypothetical protein